MCLFSLGFSGAPDPTAGASIDDENCWHLDGRAGARTGESVPLPGRVPRVRKAAQHALCKGKAVRFEDIFQV